MYMCIYIYTYTHVYIYIYIYIHIIYTYIHHHSTAYGKHFFSHKSESFISFTRSLLPRFIEKRPVRLRFEIEIGQLFKRNRLYHKAMSHVNKSMSQLTHWLFEALTHWNDMRLLHLECESLSQWVNWLLQKIQVAFAGYSLFSRALLQRRRVLLGSLLFVANS